MTPARRVTLREFLLSVMNERDQRYEDRFRAQETAVTAALAAQKELTNAAFASSEKAIIKAEAAQTSYNERTNELRGALNDQNKTLLPRNEADQRFNAVDDKLATALKAINDLQVWQGKRGGAHEQEGSGRTQNNWLIGVILGGLALIASVINTALIVALK